MRIKGLVVAGGRGKGSPLEKLSKFKTDKGSPFNLFTSVASGTDHF